MLSRIDRLAWAEPGHPLLCSLDGPSQRDAVQLLLATSIKKNDVFRVLSYLLLEGKVEGRRAAAEALADFPGAEADALVVKALADPDPVVRSHLIRQLRSRGLPGAMSLLVRMVDVPDPEIRRALCDSLPEFTMRHFLDNFPDLPDQWVSTVGNLVRKLDAQAAEVLRSEMERPSPVRRQRAIQAAMAAGLVRELEQTVIGLLSDEDHMVRVKAAKALAECDSMPTWEALRDALLDRSVVVQEAAEQSLQQISRSLLQDRKRESLIEEAETDLALP